MNKKYVVSRMTLIFSKGERLSLPLAESVATDDIELTRKEMMRVFSRLIKEIVTIHFNYYEYECND